VDRSRYFDHAATTPVHPAVLGEMLPFLSDDFGNANSLHSFGRKALAAVELARERVAALLRAEDSSQVIFTSGATEGNNWLLQNYPDAIVSPFEHSSIREPAAYLGLRTLPHVEAELFPHDDETSLVNVMRVNNETGTVWDAASLRGRATRVHSDLTQAAGKIESELDGLDFATLSAHKFYGPKGIGAIYIASDHLSPMLRGGEQEMGLRGGTLNVPGIVGMGAAAQIAMELRESNYAHALELQQIVLETLSKIGDCLVNGGQSRSPYILSISFLGIEGETLVLEADHSGYAISSGAACSSSNTEPSPVLRAMGLSDPWNRGTVRISFGTANTRESAAGLAASLQYSSEKLRTMT
jgi:cysteine desulfurase